MRNNQPVTRQEYQFDASQMLVSATDLKGRIQYCNPAFVAVSGYAREALIGQPHNLIRHPDMPAEAFGDLWRTIQSGKPWSALVKNRRKNGDYYWVRASVTPVLKSGKVAGYLSVRVKPGREEIRRAEAFYAQLRDGTGGSYRLDGGEVVRSGVVGRMQMLGRLPMRARGATALAASLLALIAGGAFAWGGRPPLPFWIATGAAALVGTLCAYALSRRVSQPVAAIAAFSTRMAAGDLTADITVDRHDQLGEVSLALNQLKANLGAIVHDVRSQIDQILYAAREISSGNADLGRRSEAQAAALEETAATMEELTTTVEANAQASARALDMAKEAQATAALGGDIAAQVEQTMTGIEDASKRIAEITGVIDGIAFQTNILALNAAVEAARAGESGRSFAVVAQEVRMLAQRCAAASKEINGVVDTTVTEIARGTQLVARTATQMRTIHEAVSRVSAIIVDVANASHEQAEGIRQVNQAVAQLDSTTQQNAGLVEQAAATAQRLVDQADVLDEAVRLFTVAGVSPSASASISRAAGPLDASSDTGHALPEAPRASANFEEGERVLVVSEVMQ